MRYTLTLLVLSLLTLAPGCQRHEIITETKTRWLEIRHRPLDEAKVGTDAIVEIEVKTSEDVGQVEAFLFFKPGEAAFDVKKMQSVEGDRFFATIPSQPRGTVVQYYVEVRGDGDLMARVPSGSGSLSLTYEGIPNRTLLLSHIILMFIATALFVLVGVLALKAFNNRQIALHIPRLALLAAAVFFISSFPLGMVVAYQTYGKAWTGNPVHALP